MPRHADYEITITDPKKGVCEHEVFRHGRRGRRRLNPWDDFVYRTSRLIKRTKKNKPYTDLDFFISKKKTTLLMFKISKNGWVFKEGENAISFKNAPSKYDISRPSDTELHLEVPGANEIGEDEYEYSLHYIDPDEQKEFVFDPIINNGSIPPSLVKAFFKITLLSTMISAGMTIGIITMLIKFGII